ncbi:MAG TPA: RDD family protein [Methylomirabilota bacterium]|jgi:uncharacterized RDD family membrane protein YckC
MDGAAPRPGGFWIRFVAFGIDLVVVMLAQFLLGFLAARRWGVDVDRSATLQGAVVFFTLLFAVLYPTVLHTLTGQTVGKLLVGVRVLAVDGELLPPGAAFLRAVVHWLSLVVLFGLGHVLGGLRKDKRALHDLLAGSRVERVPYARPRAIAVPEPAAAVPPPAGSQPL